mmetsp:Transcript_5345/g.6163  ORF Transcript_5345/g.6163 Transcript_5345/m.6163 type:complete len:237 (+) Transcript_5345:51-761(+)
MSVSSAADVKNLLKTEGYNESIIPQLESYLLSQVGDSKDPTPYDFDANRTLVKLYQFFPSKSNSNCRIVAGLLAVVYGEISEFGAISCLIPENNKAEEPFPSLIRAVESRDACSFERFWSAFHSITSEDCSAIGDLVKSDHAKTALRTSILKTISGTYKNISVKPVLAHLDLKTEAELKDFIKANASDIVENVNADSITFKDNEQNTKRDKVSQEGGIDYSMIRGLMASATVAASE